MRGNLFGLHCVIKTGVFKNRVLPLSLLDQIMYTARAQKRVRTKDHCLRRLGTSRKPMLSRPFDETIAPEIFIITAGERLHKTALCCRWIETRFGIPEQFRYGRPSCNFVGGSRCSYRPRTTAIVAGETADHYELLCNRARATWRLCNPFKRRTTLQCPHHNV